MKSQQIQKEDHQKGFTLIELIVSLGLFVIVIMAAISSLYSINDASRKMEAMRSVLDNLNFAIESMSRTIRTGTNVVCGGTLNASGDNNCSFENNVPSDRLSIEGTLGSTGLIEYQLGTNLVTNTGEIVKWFDGDWVSLTSPGIDVQRLSFYVDGANAGDDEQPSVIMLIQGVATAGENTAPFAVQTFISLRSAE